MIYMGCLHYSLEEWEKRPIRDSNIGEFPNDGSARSEIRARVFEFAKEMVNLL
jgi:hypothetical protein